MATNETKKTGKKTAASTTKSTKSTNGTSSTVNKSGKAATVSKKQVQETDDRTMKIVVGLIFIVLGVFLFAAVEFQAAGQFGNVIGEYLKGTMGLIGIIFPFYLIIVGIMMITDKTVKFSTLSFVLGLLILLMLCVINSGRFINPEKLVFNAKDFFNKGVDLKSGGLFGMGLGTFLVKYLGKVGLYAISIGVTILSTFILLKDTPIKKFINYLRIKNQERVIERNEQKEVRAKEKEDRLKEKERIKENQKKINEIKEEQKRRREENKARAILEKETNADSSDELFKSWPSLFPKDHEVIDDSSRFDKGLPLDPKEERIINVMNEETDRAPISQGLGLEPQRVAAPGHGLGEELITLPKESYDSRAEGIKIISSAEKRSTRERIETEKPVKTQEAPRKTAMSTSAPEESEKTVERISNKDARDAILDESEFNKVKKPRKYKKPSIDLLKYMARSQDLSKTNSELKEKAELLENTLKSFNVDAKVVQVTQGPAVTRYEIQPNVGVKVNKIVSLADDIALNLRARSIRIEGPIPGKAAVGIEVENDNVNMVTIRELIDSKEFKQAESKISFGVGRDIAGKAIVADLKSMPHLLIAGSTGSGKSVCINSIITSILYKADPDEVKLVLIDPKVVELGDYNGIPHLLIPVVTDATKAAASLNWAVAEMTNRYKLFADNHVKDLQSYNDFLASEGRKDEKLPQVVIIIDELADLMMAAPSQVEESICRLAQLARAAGMHLIVATQRPSVDVITGLIKANIPSRIAFAVASQFDSRTILDMGGAEKLVGKGDMLYNPLGMGKPIRVQGCFISSEETHRVIDFVKNQQDAEYDNQVLESINKGNTQGSGGDAVDELFDEAVAFVIEVGKASTSLIQRRFRIGYNRAANIIDEMEIRGIIGPAEGSKPRQVFATSVQKTEDEDNEIIEDLPAEEQVIDEAPEVIHTESEFDSEEEFDPGNSKMIQDLWDDMDNK